MLEEFIPDISPELNALWQAHPWDMKIKNNGMVLEQHLFVMAKAFREVAVQQNNELQFLGDSMLRQAKKLLFEFANKHIEAFGMDFEDFLRVAKDNPSLEEELIKSIMEWSPNWETVINQQISGQTFEFGQNKFQVDRYHKGDGKYERNCAHAICLVTGYITLEHPRFSQGLPRFSLGDKTILNLLQLEIALNRKLV